MKHTKESLMELVHCWGEDLEAALDEVFAERDELLKALQNLLKSECIDGDIAVEARKAIAKAEGGAA
jgi:hypothetical protein